MKFALAQLGNFKMPYAYDEELDLSLELNGILDIISSGVCKCHTVIEDYGYETFKFNFNIDIDLIIEDSISLEEIPYKINVDASEIFTTDTSYTDATIIDSNTIDTKEAIIEAILEEKPYSQTRHSLDEYHQNEEVEDEEENNPFAALKDLL